MCVQAREWAWEAPGEHGVSKQVDGEMDDAPLLAGAAAAGMDESPAPDRHAAAAAAESGEREQQTHSAAI